MVTVSYAYQFNYPYHAQGGRFPALVVRIASPNFPLQSVEIDAYFDSGAEGTLIDGRHARAIGLELLAGQVKRYKSTMGTSLEARLHPISLSHPDLGAFQLIAGFSTDGITRNLLGRDFFNLIQVGFRERHQVFYIEPNP